ncbi:MAG: flagellar protein FlgN [Armatimonadetes bacterium]|nr:flagellar protein FlgN [Armatimonadota bacterium]
MTDATQLARLLREELRLQTRHCKLLEAQQRALIACDRNTFCGLQDEYAQLLVHLEATTQARQEAMQDEQGKAVPLAALMEGLPARQQTLLAGVRDNLRRTLERAQELCRRNQQLIQNELAYIAFSLDLFVEAGRRADLRYGGSRCGGRKMLDRRA